MSGAAWKPVLLDAPLDEETMKRYKLIVEHLADSKFRQCMLARNVMSGGGQVTSQVSSYHKGESKAQVLPGWAECCYQRGRKAFNGASC